MQETGFKKATLKLTTFVVEVTIAKLFFLKNSKVLKK